MSAINAYQEQKAFALTRIDMLLALYDGTIERLEDARLALERRDSQTATPLLLRSQRIVTELIAGLDLDYGELPRNFQRLYAFVLRAIGVGRPEELAAALRVLRLLREGLLVVRPEAAELERRGIIPPVGATRFV